MKEIVILGAGISGRLAGKLFPESFIYESKAITGQFNAELGVQISIVPIPELECVKETRTITIDNLPPTIELIKKYRTKIGRDGDLVYGDLRQFEHQQIVYKPTFPQLYSQTYFNHTALEINVIHKSIRFLSPNEKIVNYDYLISTIPLINFVQVSNISVFFKNEMLGYFMHRPIYLSRTVEDYQPIGIFENYITDENNPIYRENHIDGIYNRESLFKIPDSIKIYPGKIYSNSSTQHLVKDLESYGVYCVGRYAEWNPTIHLWDTYTKLKLLREIL